MLDHPPQIIGFELGVTSDMYVTFSTPSPPHLFFGTVVHLLSQSSLGKLCILPGYSPDIAKPGGTVVDCSSWDSWGRPPST